MVHMHLPIHTRRQRHAVRLPLNFRSRQLANLLGASVYCFHGELPLQHCYAR